MGMVLYDLPAIRSVALVGLQGSGMVLYDLPAIRSVWPWWGCKVPGWCSMGYPPSDRCGSWACKVVRLQGSGMVLYDLPAIRSVWPGGLQGCGDSALRSTRHQIGGLVWPWWAARLWDGALWATRHQIGVAPEPAWFRGSNKTGALQITILRHWGNKKGCDPLGQHTLYQPNYNNPKTEKWGLSSRTAHPFKPYKKYCIRCPH